MGREFIKLEISAITVDPELFLAVFAPQFQFVNVSGIALHSPICWGYLQDMWSELHYPSLPRRYLS